MSRNKKINKRTDLFGGSVSQKTLQKLMTFSDSDNDDIEFADDTDMDGSDDNNNDDACSIASLFNSTPGIVKPATTTATNTNTNTKTTNSLTIKSKTRPREEGKNTKSKLQRTTLKATSTKKAKQVKSKILYRGYRCGENDPRTVSQTPITSITPETFFKLYITTRRPTLITDLLHHPDFSSLRNWKNNTYLQSKAGDAKINVERRESLGKSYGHGVPRLPTTFKVLLQRLATSKLHPKSQNHIKIDDHNNNIENSLWYLTSQTEDYEGSELPAVIASPLKELRSDFPVRPSIFGHLIPYQLNLWAGQSKVGASSGLHHDFHDNLYILIRGYKRFNIFCPADAEKIYTRGTLRAVLPNGVIEYSHQAPTREDGVPLNIALEYLEKKQEILENELESLDVSSSHAKKKETILRDKIDIVSEELLEVELQQHISNSNNKSQYDPDRPETEDEIYAHFSKIPLSLLYKQNPVNEDWISKATGVDPDSSTIIGEESSFPTFKNAIKMTVYLGPGDSLYLPAGWFHEVTSFDSDPRDGSANILTEVEADDGGHMALNYWFHPPDADTFTSPYKYSFWNDHWEKHHQHEENIDKKC